MRTSIYPLCILLAFICFSCRLYNQNILFKTKENVISSKTQIEQIVSRAEKNYVIQKNDYIEIRVYTNKGEIIISPTNTTQTQPAPLIQPNLNPGAGQVSGNQFPLIFPSFLVEQDGYAKVPMIGSVKLENLTLNQADSLLEIQFAKFYEEPFVRTRYSNKRVIVLKGQTGTIFPLVNEKVTLIEVLAQTGGVGNDLRAKNIRLIRGDLQDPTVFVIDLSTIDGLTRQNLVLEPNDIVYVEPVRKPFLESLSDINPLITLITSTATFFVTLFLLIDQANRP